MTANSNSADAVRLKKIQKAHGQMVRALRWELQKRAIMLRVILLSESVLRRLSAAVAAMHTKTRSLVISTALLWIHTAIYKAHCGLFTMHQKLTPITPRKQ